MKININLLFTLIVPFTVSSQNKLLTVEDAVLKQRNTLVPEKLNQTAWIPGTNFFTWITNGGPGKEYLVRMDASSVKKDTVMSIDDLKEVLFSANPDLPKPEKFPAITWMDKSSFRLQFGSMYYRYNIETKIIRQLVRIPKDAEEITYEPKHNRCAFVFQNNVFVIDSVSITAPQTMNDGFPFRKEEMLSQDGGYGNVNGKAVHRNEFGINKGMFWSPNGNRLAYYKCHEGMVNDYPIMDMSNRPANSKSIKYPMAGGMSHQAKIYIKDFTKSRQYEVLTGEPRDQYLTNIAWSPDEETFYVAVLNREQNEMKLNAYDGITGTFLKTLFSEFNAKYVEPEKPMVFVPNKPTQFLWFSRRDGYNHLYLYDVRGRLLKQLTHGDFEVTELLGFDQQGSTAYYIANASDGLERQVFSVNLESGKITTITRNPGIHNVVMSDGGYYFIDAYSNLSTPRKTTLMDVTGGEISILLNSWNPISAFKNCGIRLFELPSTDKKVSLNCRIIYPPQFDSTKKHPVLVYLYGGPHAQMITNSWLGGADLWLLYMAQQGYVIFTVDNRGSSNRGLDFETATFRKLGTIEREDQLAGVEFLKRQKYIDSTRLGVYGWSFGGFMSINMMTRTHAFKVGVAGGPVIDWSLYEIMYTERYMDRPQDNPEGYKDANLLNYVKDLKGKLLVIHGTSDDVVVWQHSLEYLKKCIDENIQVDYFVYPGHKHNVMGNDRVHLMQKVADYFKQNL